MVVLIVKLKHNLICWRQKVKSKNIPLKLPYENTVYFMTNLKDVEVSNKN